MNKIHSKVWSRVLNQLVVASEIAACHRGGRQGQGGRHPSLRRLSPAFFTVLMASGWIGWTPSAQAQSVDCTAAPFNAYNSTASCMGFGATASGVGATALGSISNASVLGAVAVGYAAQSTGQNGIAFGFQAYANSINAIYIGARTVPSSGATAGGAIGIGTDVTSSAANAIAMGSTSQATTQNAVAIGTNANASGGTGGLAIALGAGSKAVASNGGGSPIAIGGNSNASGSAGIVLPDGATTTTFEATALGNQATAAGMQSVSIGNLTGATGIWSTAVGSIANASGTASTAVGQMAQATNNYATALGVGGTAAATAVRASGIGALALGGNATAGAAAAGDNAIAIGGETTASAGGAVAIGLSANASGVNALASGVQAVASGLTSTAVGVNANAAGQSAAAVGALANASADFSLAMGNGAISSGLGSLAAGSGAQSTQVSATALGNNAAATAALASALGAGATASGQNAVALGARAQAAAANATAIGNSSQALAASTVAFGDSNTVAAGAGTGSIAGGHNSQVIGGLGAIALGEGQTANGNGAVAIGDPNSAIGNGAIAMGSNDAANGDGAVAIGNTNNAQGVGSVAIGSTSNALAAGAVAFGNAATANHANDVALGSGSTTSAAVGTASTTINGTTYNFTGITPTSTVSVGVVGAERTITNVAAGRISQNSTDAINGSQLYAANQAVTSVGTTVNNLGNTVAASIGGTTTYDPTTGNLTTNVTYGGNTYNSLQQVFNQINGAVSGGGIKYFHANSTLADSNAAGTDSVAIGPVSTASTTNAVSIGNGATAGVNAGDVALGAGSSTAAVVGTASTTINGTTYNFVGTTPTSTVSVGAVGAERTITNVAAGRISGSSTDAINGSQLFATNQAVNTVGATVTTLGNSIANSYGGSTAYDPVTGAINTSISYGGNTYSSLQQIFNQIGGSISGSGIKYFHANSGLADSAANGLNSVAIGPVSTANTENAVSIGNGATAGANVGDVALGAGSTTGAVVATTGGTIAGNAYTYAGTAPTSTVSVGATGAERTVTNVAAGQVNASSTDAINGSQLFATNQALDTLNNTVVASATHYYSVNDGGTQGGNYANNGATGLNALAAGVGAAATADSGTALGQNTGVSVLGGVALGSGAVSDRAIAPASGSILVGTNVIPYNTTDRNLLGAVSVGNAADFRQITNVADGTLDQDAVTLRQLKGAMSSFSVTPIKYFHANSTASDSLAAGAESVAIGPQTTVNGDNGIGMGNGAIVQQTAPGGTAIGQNATVNLADGVALGTNATSNGIQAMALGAGTEAAFAGSVALGAGSKTDAAVGTASTTLNGVTFNFAGATPGSTVSVGSVGAERTLTNVAAGRISGSSTDAINGSQLYATDQTLDVLYSQFNSLSTTVNNLPKGGGTTVNNTFQTSTDNITQASSSGDNSTAAGAGSTASGNSSTAVGSGSTASGDNSVAIGAGSVASQDNTVSVGSAGHERTVTNVAEGVNSTDAVNVGQLSDAIAQAKDWAKDYTDQRFQSVNNDLNRIGNRADAGIASAMAMASLPQAYQPNQSSAGLALGSFHGEAGFAVGVSTISESGRYVFKLNATTNSRGDTGAGVGAGVVW